MSIWCNDENKVIFITLPKCGSTDFNYNIIDFLKKNKYSFNSQINHKKITSYKIIIIILIEKWASYVSPKNIFSFTNKRHMFD